MITGYCNGACCGTISNAANRRRGEKYECHLNAFLWNAIASSWAQLCLKSTEKALVQSGQEEEKEHHVFTSILSVWSVSEICRFVKSRNLF